MVDGMVAWGGGHGEWCGLEYERGEGGEVAGSWVEHTAWVCWRRLGGVGGVAGWRRAAVLCSCESGESR